MPGRFENESTYQRFAAEGRAEEFDSLFDEAVENTKASFGAKYPMYIGGKEAYAPMTLAEGSPISSDIVIGHFQKGSAEHAKAAIEAAGKAFQIWSNTDYKERAVIFNKIADIFSREKFNLAAILSYENAKSRYESVGEVDEAIDFMRYYANELLINKGFARKTKLAQSSAKVAAGFQGAPSTGEDVTIRMRAYGVFGVIAPFNFPISISVGMSAGALITGNTVVFKPSSSDNMTMLTGLKIYELFKEGGIPDGVFNYITGPGSVVGDELATNDAVAGIAFTGSKAIGLGMMAKNFSQGKKKVFVVEMGGKNPVIIGKKCDMDKAVTGVASAAFGFAGQKCSALSRVYVHESIKEMFISKLIDKARTFKIGNPLKKDVYLGPLISKNAFDTYNDAIIKARSTGRVLYGGNAVNVGLKGYYVEPAIIDVRHDNELVHRELFVPILSVEGYRHFDDALKMANDVDYGLTAGLYTTSNKEIKEFTSKIQAGVVYINREISATTGAIVGVHTFVGWKDSGLTGKGTGSKHYLQQFMREQSVSLTK
ncbi:MAG: aldehyde dehydrogenase family protein [Candidatus Micrarchaeota archaeon]|nr:aldehyde dehydrogenase family protein [Candidatus Micrarchaeota archaeon]